MNYATSCEKSGPKFENSSSKGPNIYVRNRRAAERVMQSIRDFLQKRLKLKVNEEKSSVDRPWKLKCLGFRWLRRRLRMCLWKQWKRVRTRYRELRARLPEWVVHQFANAYKGPWRMAHGPMNRALGITYREAQSLMSLTARYQSIRQTW